MSLKKKENSKSIIKSQKDIILEKIHRIKSYNTNLIKECFPLKQNTNIKSSNSISPFYSQSKNINYDSNRNSTYKKVFIKPLVKENRLHIKQKYLSNNCTLTKNLNLSKIQKLNKNNKIDINNNIINNNIINLENKTIINKDNSLNETTSDYEIEKIQKFKRNIYSNKENIIINDNFNSLNREKKNNLIKLKTQNSHSRKKSNEINRICLKNNNNININILEKVHTTKGKDSIKINSINLISNDNINKINNPFYLSKIFSLSNTINEADTISNINPEILQTDYKIEKHKKMRNKIFLNNTNCDINKKNEEIQPNSNYYNSITDISPNSRIAKIEINGLNLNSYKNDNKNKKINLLETKRNIINSIEREKKKIINESIKNYRKYLFLIQKQQKEYEEYDQYLMNELNNNLNNKLKLQILKNKLKSGITNKSNFDVLKNKKMKNEGSGIIPDIDVGENKTFSSKNFDSKKYRNKNMKIFVLPNKNLYDEKKISTTMGGYRPLLNEENDSDLNFKTNNNERSIQSINKKGLKISIDDLKKYKKLVNKKNNYNNIINKKTNNKIIIKKNISNLKEDYSSYDTFKKSKQKINTVILNNRFNNKTELDLFNVGNKKLALKNIKKNSILKKLMKDKKIGKQKEQKIKYNQINKTTLSNTNNNDYKCQSLKKIENFQDYYEQKTLSNIPLKNIHKIHRMITEEKNKALNKLNVNILKYKDKKNLNQLYSQIKNKAIISNKNNLIDGETAQTFNKNE